MIEEKVVFHFCSLLRYGKNRNHSIQQIDHSVELKTDQHENQAAEEANNDKNTE